MSEIAVIPIQNEEAKEEEKTEEAEQQEEAPAEETPTIEEQPPDDPVPEEKPEEKKFKVMTEKDMNKLKQKNYSTRNARNETIYCAECKKYMSKHNYRYNHLCKPLREKKLEKTLVNTAVDMEAIKADIMKQLKEDMMNEQKSAKEAYNKIKEEKNTQKKEKIKSLASKIL